MVLCAFVVRIYFITCIFIITTHIAVLFLFATHIHWNFNIQENNLRI